MRSILADYPVTADAELLLNGFTYGFCMGYAGPRLPRDSLCLASALERPVVVLKKLDSEIALCRIAGPFFERPFLNPQCSPIGLVHVPKWEPNSFCLIQHLSFPACNFINSHINRDLCTVHYASLDAAVVLARIAGHGAWLAKADVKSAFRLLPIAPRHVLL